VPADSRENVAFRVARSSLDSGAMIVCGYDGSPHALEALEVAYRLSRKLGTQIAVVQALDILGIEYDVELRAKCAAELEATLASFGDASSAELHITSGTPVDDVLNAARTASAELIVIGAHGHGHADLASRLGSTTDGIVAKSELPVLVVRHAAPILDALASRTALRTLVAIDPDGPTLALQWTKALLATVVGDLHAVCIAHGEETPAVDTQVEIVRDKRPTATVIAERAAREHVGLVVVGRKAKRQLLPRSLARTIVREAATNVVCVPGPS